MSLDKINKIMNTVFLQAVIVLSLFGVTSIIRPHTVVAANDFCKGLEMTGGTCREELNPDGTPKKDGVTAIIETVITVLSLVVGVVSVIMIIIGGFKYIISSGDSNNVTSAKNTILYAIVGLVVAALAQIIVKFVLNRVT